MKTWLIHLWDSLRTNFWFVPTLMVVGAIGLSFLTIRLDRETVFYNWIATLGWTFTRGPEGSRAVLSTIASSMITICSITFSITIVALQLASSQFGPRLLRNFMRDQGNQIVLGTFIATFTYCVLILRTVNGTNGPEAEPYVPHFSVTFAVVMGLASLGVVIYFIHHVATSIQADQVIASVSHDLIEAVDWLYPRNLGHTADIPKDECKPWKGDPLKFERESCSIKSPRSDYLQAIDNEGLVSLASEHDLILSLEHRPGQFIVKNTVIVRAYPASKVTDDLVGSIQDLFYFGPQRTMVQDAEFAIDQLVEIAVRALSPGINDPFTAMTCIDRLGAGLCHLASKEIPSAYRSDDQGNLRVIADQETVTGMVDAALNQIRQVSRTNAAVTIRLLETIAIIGEQARDDLFHRSLYHHAHLIHRASQESLPEAYDRSVADERFLKVLRRLESSGWKKSADDEDFPLISKPINEERKDEVCPAGGPRRLVPEAVEERT